MVSAVDGPHDASGRQSTDLLRQLDAIENLPVLSEHHQRLRALVNDDRATMQQVCALIEKDPTFAANLVRVANSPIFGQRVSVDSIKRAVLVVGFRGVGEMSLTLEVVQSFGFPNGLSVPVFWTHAVRVAELAKELAQHQGGDCEQAYLLGLLHDVGLLVIAKFLPEVFDGLMARVGEGASIHEVCLALHGCGPMDVTARLLARWGFAPTLCEAVCRFWRTDRDIDHDADRLAIVVHNAHGYCARYPDGGFPWDHWPAVPPDQVLDLGREPGAFTGIGEAILACCTPP